MPVAKIILYHPHILCIINELLKVPMISIQAWFIPKSQECGLLASIFRSSKGVCGKLTANWADSFPVVPPGPVR